MASSWLKSWTCSGLLSYCFYLFTSTGNWKLERFRDFTLPRVPPVPIGQWAEIPRPGWEWTSFISCRMSFCIIYSTIEKKLYFLIFDSNINLTYFFVLPTFINHYLKHFPFKKLPKFKHFHYMKQNLIKNDPFP